MGQREIYELLKNKRLSGDYSYFSSEEIRKLLGEKGYCNERRRVNNALSNLRIFGYLDEKILAVKYRKRSVVKNAYRLKREFC